MKTIICYVDTNRSGSKVEWTMEVPDNFSEDEIQEQFEMELGNYMNAGWWIEE